MPFARRTLVESSLGFDSVQGYLELGLWYDRQRVTFCCDPEDESVFHSMYSQLRRLESEGHIIAEWLLRDDGGLELKQVALTTSGHKLLGELRAQSRWGKVKERLATIGWAAVTAVITTLAVLWVTGE